MRFTRRFRAVAALAGALAVFGALVDALAPLVGAAAVGAWLLARQYAFLRSLRRARDDLSVVTVLAPERIPKDGTATLSLAARLDAASELELRVGAELPPGVEGEDPEARLSPGQREAETGSELAPAFAGRHEFGRPSVEARTTLFAERFHAGETVALTAEPRSARGLHLGAGGEQVAAAYGEHPGGEGGSGLDPAEIRAYMPGDPASRIDWKATARLGEAHVREFEAETDRRTVLLLDHRSTTGVGEPGATALDYLREVALGVAGAAESWEDPLGFYAVGDEGLTAEFVPSTAPERYDAVRDRIRRLSPTPAPDERRRRQGADPAAANRRAAALTGDEGAFARTLRPYFASGDRYVRRVEDRPLFSVARRVGRLNDRRWTVLLTDDSDRAAVRETAKLLRRGGNHVLCVLAPTALFEPDGLAEPDAGFRQYADFESFRSELASLPRVQALEVAPGDRLDAALAGVRT